MSNMTDRIARIKARCEAATPGPWRLGEDETIEAESDCIAHRLNTLQDAQFIAHSREDIPYLLDQLAEREKEIERYKDWSETKNELIVKLANEAHKANTELDRLREAQRWIPVSERLPEPNDYILAFTPAYKNIASLTHTSRGYMARLPKTDITHWQPLPAAPEETKGETENG